VAVYTIHSFGKNDDDDDDDDSDDDDDDVTTHREPTSKDNRIFSKNAIIENYCVLGCETV
jgi:hypothetical protein